MKRILQQFKDKVHLTAPIRSFMKTVRNENLPPQDLPGFRKACRAFIALRLLERETAGKTFDQCSTEGSMLIHQIAALEATRFLGLIGRSKPSGRLGVFVRTGGGKTMIQAAILNLWYHENIYRFGIATHTIQQNFYKTLIKTQNTFLMKAYDNYMAMWGPDAYNNRHKSMGFIIHVLEHIRSSRKLDPSEKPYGVIPESIVRHLGWDHDNADGVFQPGVVAGPRYREQNMSRLLCYWRDKASGEILSLRPGSEGFVYVDKAGRVVPRNKRRGVPMRKPFRMYTVEEVASGDTQLFVAGGYGTNPERGFSRCRILVDEAHELLQTREGREILEYLRDKRHNTMLVACTATPGTLLRDVLLPAGFHHRSGDGEGAYQIIMNTPYPGVWPARERFDGARPLELPASYRVSVARVLLRGENRRQYEERSGSSDCFGQPDCLLDLACGGARSAAVLSSERLGARPSLDLRRATKLAALAQHLRAEWGHDRRTTKKVHLILCNRRCAFFPLARLLGAAVSSYNEKVLGEDMREGNTGFLLNPEAAKLLLLGGGRETASSKQQQETWWVPALRLGEGSRGPFAHYVEFGQNTRVEMLNSIASVREKSRGFRQRSAAVSRRRRGGDRSSPHTNPCALEAPLVILANRAHFGTGVDFTNTDALWLVSPPRSLDKYTQYAQEAGRIMRMCSRPSEAPGEEVQDLGGRPRVSITVLAAHGGRGDDVERRHGDLARLEELDLSYRKGRGVPPGPGLGRAPLLAGDVRVRPGRPLGARGHARAERLGRPLFLVLAARAQTHLGF